jgi:hypothetical protein
MGISHRTTSVSVCLTMSVPLFALATVSCTLSLSLSHTHSWYRLPGIASHTQLECVERSIVLVLRQRLLHLQLHTLPELATYCRQHASEAGGLRRVHRHQLTQLSSDQHNTVPTRHITSSFQLSSASHGGACLASPPCTCRGHSPSQHSLAAIQSTLVEDISAY